MRVLYIITAVSLLISLLCDRRKTGKALIGAVKKMRNILIPFLNMLIFVSVVLFAVPDEMIAKYLSHSDHFTGIITASLLGSITLMPGFIAFPLCGILLEKQVDYSVLSAFSTTLMMVGIVTFPIEKKYFGTKITLMRNGISFAIALTIALVTGLFYGEIL